MKTDGWLSMSAGNVLNEGNGYTASMMSPLSFFLPPSPSITSNLSTLTSNQIRSETLRGSKNESNVRVSQVVQGYFQLSRLRREGHSNSSIPQQEGSISKENSGSSSQCILQKLQRSNRIQQSMLLYHEISCNVTYLKSSGRSSSNLLLPISRSMYTKHVPRIRTILDWYSKQSRSISSTQI